MTNSNFAHTRNYFWQWEDNGQIVAIPDGNTIAYRELILQTLEELCPQGIPRFGSLLLILTALNPNGEESLKSIKAIVFQYVIAEEEYELAFMFLNNVQSLNNLYKSGQYKKLIIKAIFEGAHNNLSRDRSDFVVNLLKEENGTELDNWKEKPKVTLRQDLKVLALLQKKFPTQESLLDQISNLEDIEEEILVEDFNKEQPTDFIGELIEDFTTNEIGSLVRMLWSGLNLPFHNSAPSERPMGGVSDLTNKGSLDQLLISEFANDDLVFLSRLANNEALYLSRETPPESNEMTRVILIDVSLKNWGTPKSIAFATMLAISNHPKTDIECEVYIVGSKFHLVEHNTVKGIIDAIQFVYPVLDCSLGLRAYFNEHPLSKNRELFILTEYSTQFYSPMVSISNEFKELINFWIYNDVNGKIEIFKKLKNSKKHVQTINLPFERLWKEHRPKQQNTERINSDYYPILIRNYGNKDVITTSNDEKFQITKDKKLLRVFDKDTQNNTVGMEIVCEDLSIHERDFSMGITNSGEYYLLILKRQLKEVTILNIRTKKEIKVHFPEWKYKGDFSFIYHEGKFHHYHESYHNGSQNHNSNYIDLEGNLGHDSIDLSSKFLEEKKSRENLISVFYVSQSILKNVNSISINENKDLTFNNHIFSRNSYEHITLSMKGKGYSASLKKNDKVTAIEGVKGRFIFPDGSYIINKIGYFILKSSDQSIPEIYVPAFLDSTIGIGTVEEFTGNEIYLNKALYEINLINPGGSPLKCVKLIKEVTGFGLQKSKDFVDNWPCNLQHYFTKEEADIAINKFRGIGVEVSLVNTNPAFETPTVVKPFYFFKKHIIPFINTILEYGS